MKGTLYARLFKRIIDLTMALFALIVCSPLLLFAAGALYFLNDRQIWFIQPRPGKDEKIFNLIKFKTMNDRKDANNNLLPDSQRITGIGRFLRSSSIDELPQLINVLKGDMSLVGPRPLLVKYLALYNDQQRVRHKVRPGITGWAQVNGRNAVSWEQRFLDDCWYVNNVSFMLDAQIIIKTLRKVMTRDGVNSSPSTTMVEFKGTQTHNSEKRAR